MKTIKNKAVILLFMYFLPLVSFSATGGGAGSPTGLNNPLREDTIVGLLDVILGIMMTIGTPIIVIFIIYSGFKFVTARGNPQKLEDAKKTIQWTLVGAAVLLGARVLSALIQGTIDLF